MRISDWSSDVCSSDLVANLSQVVIFRNIDGRRAGAVFDVKAIREGRTPDPEILGGDVIVVGFDAVKGAFRDFFKMAPFFYVFRYFCCQRGEGLLVKDRKGVGSEKGV